MRTSSGAAPVILPSPRFFKQHPSDLNLTLTETSKKKKEREKQNNLQVAAARWFWSLQDDEAPHFTTISEEGTENPALVERTVSRVAFTSGSTD